MVKGTEKVSRGNTFIYRTFTELLVYGILLNLNFAFINVWNLFAGDPDSGAALEESDNYHYGQQWQVRRKLYSESLINTEMGQYNQFFLCEPVVVLLAR